MTGSSPSWSSHPARRASCWCSLPQAVAGSGAVPAGLGERGHRRGGPGARVGEPERGPVPGRPAVRAGLARRRGGEVHHPVAAQPARDLDRQVAQQPGQPGQVIAGVEDHQDVRVAVAPVPGGDDPLRRRRGPGRRSPRSRHRPGRAGPRPAAASTRCGPAPAPRRASTASPGSSARSPCPARNSGRTGAPGWWPRPAAASCSHPPPAGSGRRPRPAAAAPPAPAQPRDLDPPAFTASYSAP